MLGLFFLGTIPDALTNLKQLRDFQIYDTSITKITEKLATMSSLHVIQMTNCSLTSFPDLSNLLRLILLDVPHNHLAHLIVPPAVGLLDLNDNHFTELPVHPAPEALRSLRISSNPWRNLDSLGSYKNLRSLALGSANLTSLPSNIDQLDQIKVVNVSDNKLTHLPDGIFKSPLLIEFDATKNSFPADEIQAIKNAFEKSHPQSELKI